MEMVNETLNEDDDLMMTDESDIAMLARFYYCFMLACILIGLTGNSMVWVLIRFVFISFIIIYGNLIIFDLFFFFFC